MKRLVLGGIAVFIVLLILNGWYNTMTIFLLSIVCTAGVGVIFWFAIFYIVGACMDLGLQKFNSNKKGLETQVKESKQFLAVKDYVTLAKTSGLTNGEIVTNLKAKNWDDKIINQALQTS